MNSRCLRVWREGGYHLRTYFLLLLCLLLTAVPILARDSGTGAVMGFVFNQRGDPLIGATVMVEGTSHGAMAAALGDFIIEDLSEGPATLWISMVGMVSQQLEVDIAAGDTLEVEIWLEISPPSGGTPAVIIRI